MYMGMGCTSMPESLSWFEAYRPPVSLLLRLGFLALYVRGMNSPLVKKEFVWYETGSFFLFCIQLPCLGF
jgi:hypothetical protein